MPASLKRIRETMDVAPTPKDKGLALTIRVVAYDNGMVQLDGVPLNDQADYDPTVGWLAACEIAVATLGEFRRQVEARKKEKTQPVA